MNSKAHENLAIGAGIGARFVNVTARYPVSLPQPAKYPWDGDATAKQIVEICKTGKGNAATEPPKMLTPFIEDILKDERRFSFKKMWGVCRWAFQRWWRQ